MSTRASTRRRASAAATPRPRHGTSGPVAALIVFVIAALGGMIDVFTGPGLRTLFAIALIAGTVIAALLVAWQESLWVVFAPPLICLALALINVVATSHSAVGLAADYLTHGFPPIAVAVGAAALINGVRALAARSR